GFSVHPRTEDLHPIELAGADGFFNKGTDTERLIDRLLLRHASRPSCHVGKPTDVRPLESLSVDGKVAPRFAGDHPALPMQVLQYGTEHHHNAPRRRPP